MKSGSRMHRWPPAVLFECERPLSWNQILIWNSVNIALLCFEIDAQPSWRFIDNSAKEILEISWIVTWKVTTNTTNHTIQWIHNLVNTVSFIAPSKKLYQIERKNNNFSDCCQWSSIHSKWVTYDTLHQYVTIMFHSSFHPPFPSWGPLFIPGWTLNVSNSSKWYQL